MEIMKGKALGDRCRKKEEREIFKLKVKVMLIKRTRRLESDQQSQTILRMQSKMNNNELYATCGDINAFDV